ncbi:MAG: hypothetical protein LBF94_02920 [Puniceicoccales bacterium]|jgi:hypothetical protein|nr:hypothetical protein [Puniceicoccales bacterium]
MSIESVLPPPSPPKANPGPSPVGGHSVASTNRPPPSQPTGGPSGGGVSLEKRAVAAELSQFAGTSPVGGAQGLSNNAHTSFTRSKKDVSHWVHKECIRLTKKWYERWYEKHDEWCKKHDIKPDLVNIFIKILKLIFKGGLSNMARAERILKKLRDDEIHLFIKILTEVARAIVIESHKDPEVFRQIKRDVKYFKKVCEEAISPIH